MLRILGAAALLAVAGTSLSQTQSQQTTPSVAPSQTPAVTPSQTPSVTPSTGAPIVGTTAPAPVIQERHIGGMSRCENMLAFERDKCLQDESAAGGGTRAPAYGTGATTPTPQSPAPAATEATTPQSPTPAGSTR